MARINYLKSEEIKPEDPVRKTANTKRVRRLCRILEDLQGMGCAVRKDTSQEGHGWVIVVDGESTDLPFPDGLNPFSPAPTTPTVYTTLGTNTKGDEAAETDTWTYGDVDGSGNKKGLWFWVQVRQAYYEAGDKKWYAYARKLIFSTTGQLYSVSAATRIEVTAMINHADI